MYITADGVVGDGQADQENRRVSRAERHKQNLDYQMATLILVTGGNRGIGFGIVQAIGTRLPSATILIGCRALATGQDAIQKLRDLGVKSELDLVIMDIEDDASITAAASAVDKKYGKLDGTQHPQVLTGGRKS